MFDLATRPMPGRIFSSCIKSRARERELFPPETISEVARSGPPSARDRDPPAGVEVFKVALKRHPLTANSIEEMHEAVKLILVGNQLWPLLYPRRICPRMNGSGSRPMILLPETTSVG